MATESNQIYLDIPDFGRVPVQVKHDPDRNTFDITHCPPSGDGKGRNGGHYDPRLDFKTSRIVPFFDPTNRIPQFAVQKQKIVTLTKSQLDQLLAGKLDVGTSPDRANIELILGSLKLTERISRITRSDCPDPDLSADGQLQYTVLLDWTEDTAVTFPTLLFRDQFGNITEPISQTNNFLVVSDKDKGSNEPPVHPPVTATGPLNSQPSDYRPATQEDLDHYQQYSGQDNGLAVAVIDTGLKYNLHNPNAEGQWPDPYMYRDASGQERRFIVAYQNESDVNCGDLMTDNHLGYCSLQSYRQDTFIAGVVPLETTVGPVSYTPADIVNSPFDDFRIFEALQDGTDGMRILDARHGTSVTAIIQQMGDDAPVLPVKAFDNLGFATLFDVLNGLNYILNRCKKSNIRVVNASWIFGRDEFLLKKKIQQLMEAGVFVVAAAGNEGQTIDRNLDAVPVYPACYSSELANVITVTSVRKTYFPHNLLSPKEDSVIEKALSVAVKVGLFGLLDKFVHLIDALFPIGGYVAVENYSKTFVNVGVVSTFGYYRSPFWKSPIIRGSSFACALVSGFVIRQLRTNPDLVPTGAGPVSRETMDGIRQTLLKAMGGTDRNLKDDYIQGGYYLNGYAVD